jgi:hypothetical protein
VSILIVGFAAVVLLLIAAVTDASAAFLRRQALEALADGAALAAADGVHGEYAYNHGLGSLAHIDPALARQHVSEYLASTGSLTRIPGLRWTVEPEGTSVTVRLSAPLDLPITPPGWLATATVEGVASAVAPVS